MSIHQLHQYGYYKIAAAVPAIQVGDVRHNQTEILRLIHQAAEEKVSLLAFPELCLSGATCGALFHQSLLAEACHRALLEIAAEAKEYSFPIVLGSPIQNGGRLFNCAVVIIQGEIVGAIPKQLLTAKESQYFSIFPSDNEEIYNFSNASTSSYPIFWGNHLSFCAENDRRFCFAVEMGEVGRGFFWPAEVNPLNKVNIIVNPVALPAKIGFLEKTELMLKAVSQKSSAIYLHVGSGFGESTTHYAFAGQAYIVENGSILSQSSPYSWQSHLTIGLVDLDKISFLKRADSLALKPSPTGASLPYHHVIDYPAASQASADASLPLPDGKTIESAAAEVPLLAKLPRFPFIPDDAEQLERHCRSIVDIIVSACIKRFSHIQSKSAVIGVSGGLDSTLALLLLAESYRRMGKPLSEIIGVRMPGFGTSGKTYENSCRLMKLLCITEKEVDIKASVLLHLKDIGHPAEQQDLTYENAQARERTQILMDIANQTGGLVIGTGDLSELALGFCTYNGDHMSMYSVNASIPKTLIPYVIRSLGRHYSEPELLSILESIINTPISPELLPPTANQQILQKTEELIGPYALHDFFLYYMLRYGFSPRKIRALAIYAFAEDFSRQDVDKWIKVFYRRFFSQQFKRNCLPDGPVLGSVTLFADFQMPSDACAALWLADLEDEFHHD